jgi:hypothetical protein
MEHLEEINRFWLDRIGQNICECCFSEDHKLNCHKNRQRNLSPVFIEMYQKTFKREIFDCVIMELKFYFRDRGI